MHTHVRTLITQRSAVIYFGGFACVVCRLVLPSVFLHSQGCMYTIFMLIMISFLPPVCCKVGGWCWISSLESFTTITIIRHKTLLLARLCMGRLLILHPLSASLVELFVIGRGVHCHLIKPRPSRVAHLAQDSEKVQYLELTSALWVPLSMGGGVSSHHVSATHVMNYIWCIGQSERAETP